MARFLRTFLLWLSLLVHPVQGMAGNLMLICMSDGHEMAASSMHIDDCDGAVRPVGSAMPEADNGDAPEGVEVSTLTCGAGSMCSSSVALPTVPLKVPDTGPAIAPSSFVSVSPIGFFTGGPDRPPRPAFA
jgi:hypothetical protein